MSEHRVPHAAGSIHDLVRKATHSPAIMTKAETIRLAEHVLKGGEHATEEEQAIGRGTPGTQTAPGAPRPSAAGEATHWHRTLPGNRPRGARGDERRDPFPDGSRETGNNPPVAITGKW
ncbi:hypothetical protein [Komagataeibacter europaeus]|uniref:hypothetical protein n=1 Tax=Komagataeibacter europaeus TaxID=33995 RepID=UPI0002EBC32E|nr:hypothetical protein [Komagataeibacter europaeus]